MANRNDLSRQIRRRNERVMVKLITKARRTAALQASKPTRPAPRPGIGRRIINTVRNLVGAPRRNHL